MFTRRLFFLFLFLLALFVPVTVRLYLLAAAPAEEYAAAAQRQQRHAPGREHLVDGQHAFGKAALWLLVAVGHGHALSTVGHEGKHVVGAQREGHHIGLQQHAVRLRPAFVQQCFQPLGRGGTEQRGTVPVAPLAVGSPEEAGLIHATRGLHEPLQRA